MVGRGKTMFSTWSDEKGQFDRKNVGKRGVFMLLMTTMLLMLVSAVEDNPRLNTQETLSPRHLGLQIIRYSAAIITNAYEHVVNMLQIIQYSCESYGTVLLISIVLIKVPFNLRCFSISLLQ